MFDVQDGDALTLPPVEYFPIPRLKSDKTADLEEPTRVQPITGYQDDGAAVFALREHSLMYVDAENQDMKSNSGRNKQPSTNAYYPAASTKHSGLNGTHIRYLFLNTH